MYKGRGVFIYSLFLLGGIDKCNTIVYNRSMKLKEDNKIIIKHFRVTEEDSKKLEKQAREEGFSSVSDLIRFRCGLHND